MDREKSIRELEREYKQEIRDLAENVLAESAKYGQEWSDILHETVDSHEWVIYAWKARVVMILTDNPTAHEDELGERGSESAEAFMAMRADVEAEVLRILDNREVTL